MVIDFYIVNIILFIKKIIGILQLVSLYKKFKTNWKTIDCYTCVEYT